MHQESLKKSFVIWLQQKEQRDYFWNFLEFCVSVERSQNSEKIFLNPNLKSSIWIKFLGPSCVEKFKLSSQAFIQTSINLNFKQILTCTWCSIMHWWCLIWCYLNVKHVFTFGVVTIKILLINTLGAWRKLFISNNLCVLLWKLWNSPSFFTNMHVPCLVIKIIIVSYMIIKPEVKLVVHQVLCADN